MNVETIALAVCIVALVLLVIHILVRIESLERRARKHEDWVHISGQRLSEVRNRVGDLQAAVTVLSDAVAPIDDKEQP